MLKNLFVMALGLFVSHAAMAQDGAEAPKCETAQCVEAADTAVDGHETFYHTLDAWKKRAQPWIDNIHAGNDPDCLLGEQILSQMPDRDPRLKASLVRNSFPIYYEVYCAVVVTGNPMEEIERRVEALETAPPPEAPPEPPCPIPVDDRVAPDVCQLDTAKLKRGSGEGGSALCWGPWSTTGVDNLEWSAGAGLFICAQRTKFRGQLGGYLGGVMGLGSKPWASGWDLSNVGKDRKPIWSMGLRLSVVRKLGVVAIGPALDFWALRVNRFATRDETRLTAGPLLDVQPFSGTLEPWFFDAYAGFGGRENFGLSTRKYEMGLWIGTGLRL